MKTLLINVLNIQIKQKFLKKKIKIELLDIYNDKKNQFNFPLKQGTIDYIIKKWQILTLRFTKYYALQNIYNTDNDIILWDHRNPIIYVPNKKHPISSEYFIWSHDQLISRARVAKNF